MVGITVIVFITFIGDTAVTLIKRRRITVNNQLSDIDIIAHVWQKYHFQM